jgi:hypothetical protein
MAKQENVNYDNDPRYTKLEDGVYLDTETNETIIVLEDEAAEGYRKIFNLDENTKDHNMTEAEFLKLFSDDSDLNEL